MSKAQRIVIAIGAAAIGAHSALAVSWLESQYMSHLDILPLATMRSGWIDPPVTKDGSPFIVDKSTLYCGNPRLIYPPAKRQLGIELGGIVVAALGAFVVLPVFTRLPTQYPPDEPF